VPHAEITIDRTLAPIVVFCYRRPQHLKRTLKSLLRCDLINNSRIIIYCDGPKNSDQMPLVLETRQTAVSLLGARAEYHFSDVNLGLARSIIDGVGSVVRRYGRAIVLEDDLECSPFFLSFMNLALDKYSTDSRVWQVSGYMFNLPKPQTQNSAFFLPFTVSWGWATWDRAWNRFDPSAQGWRDLQHDPLLKDRFDLDGAYPFSVMLQSQMEGQLDSWAIRWYWTVFCQQGLVLFPPRTLITNHGFDGSGSHGRGFLRNFRSGLLSPPTTIPSMPEFVSYSPSDLKTVSCALKIQNSSLLRRLFKVFLSFFR